MMPEILRIGLDIGSTTIKCVVLDEADKIIYSCYERHLSLIAQKTRELLTRLDNEVVHGAPVRLSISGSAGMGLALGSHISFVQEVYATKVAADMLMPGTDVIMHIKEDESGEKYSTYLENWKLMMLIRKYSDYVRWPIVMDVEQSDWVDTGEKDEKGEPKMEMVTKTEEQTINSMVPIWQRRKSSVKPEEYNAFYKEKFGDWQDPLTVIHTSAEGAVTYKALLFIPGATPFDYYTKEFEKGLQLYSNGVLIMDKCADLLPDHFLSLIHI